MAKIYSTLLFALILTSNTLIAAEVNPTVINTYTIVAKRLQKVGMAGNIATLLQCESDLEECDAIQLNVETGQFYKLDPDLSAMATKESAAGDLSGIVVTMPPNKSAYVDLQSGARKLLDLRPQDFNLGLSGVSTNLNPNNFWGGKALFYSRIDGSSRTLGFFDVNTWEDFELFTGSRNLSVCGVAADNRVILTYASPLARLVIIQIDQPSGSKSIIEYDIDFPDRRNIRSTQCISDGNTIFLSYAASVWNGNQYVEFDPLMEIDIANEQLRQYSYRTFNHMLGGRIFSTSGTVWLSMDLKYGNPGSAGGRTYKIEDLYGAPKISDSHISLAQITPSDDPNYAYSDIQYETDDASMKTVYFYKLPSRLVNDTPPSEMSIGSWKPLIRIP
jgi:hypothetical protein